MGSKDLVIPKYIENLRRQYANEVRSNLILERIYCTMRYLFMLLFCFQMWFLAATHGDGVGGRVSSLLSRRLHRKNGSDRLLSAENYRY